MRPRRVWIGCVRFGSQTPGFEHTRRGGDDERPVGALECCAERLDGALVGASGDREVREVVDERGVDDAVGRGRAGVQAVEVVEGAGCTSAPVPVRAAAAASERAGPTT
jgi:hypothetical protein